jgi:hypothetical protein
MFHWWQRLFARLREVFRGADGNLVRPNCFRSLRAIGAIAVVVLAGPLDRRLLHASLSAGVVFSVTLVTLYLYGLFQLIRAVAEWVFLLKPDTAKPLSLLRRN